MPLGIDVTVMVLESSFPDLSETLTPKVYSTSFCNPVSVKELAQTVPATGLTFKIELLLDQLSLSHVPDRISSGSPRISESMPRLKGSKGRITPKMPRLR